MNTQEQNLVFSNLLTAFINKQIEDLKEFSNGLESETDFNKWYYNQLCTKAKPISSFSNTHDLKLFLISRKQKEQAKKLKAVQNKLKLVSEAPELFKINISVEWKKSATWGANPTAEVRVLTTDGYKLFIGKASGCGYDKESAAIAQALNQSYSFLNLIYSIRENNTTESLRELLGYGSGYGLFPRLEGGVGVSCFRSIFEKLGFKWEDISHGKSFDVYTVSKLGDE